MASQYINLPIPVGGGGSGLNQLTGDVTAGPGSGSQVAVIPSGTVTNAKMATMATQTIKGRATAGTGAVEDLTSAQATSILSNVVGDSGSGGTKGLVPAPAALDNVKQKFLRADGSWSGQADRYTPNNEAVTQINTFAQRSTTANQWFGMAYAPEINTYVAIAASGTNRFSISKDGLNWQDIAAPQNSIWSKVCWSSYLGIFCAVSYDGASQVATSPDGFVWTLRTASAACTWYDIAWSPELRLFAATSLTGGVAIMTSPDGITWTSRTTSDATTTNYYTVCWSPELSLFCAVRLNGAAFTSSDGITWTARTGISNKSWSSVCWSPNLGLFCAVGISGTNRCDTSPDGINWTPRGIQANAWRRVVWAPDQGMFIAVASGGQMSTSFDGITWTARTAPQATNQWYEIIAPQGTGQILICGITGTGRRMTATPSRAVTKQFVPRVVNLVVYESGTAVTLGGIHSTSTVAFSAATAVTVTIPTDATAYFRNGTIIKLVQYGAGVVTVGGAGVTIRSRGGLLSSNGQYSVMTLEKINANEWVLSGDRA